MAEHWITINGSHVLIDDEGKVLKGNAKLKEVVGTRRTNNTSKTVKDIKAGKSYKDYEDKINGRIENLKQKKKVYNEYLKKAEKRKDDWSIYQNEHKLYDDKVKEIKELIKKEKEHKNYDKPIYNQVLEDKGLKQKAEKQNGLPKMGDTFKNKNGAIIKVTEPTINGNPQFNIASSEEDYNNGRYENRGTNSYESLEKILKLHEYSKIENLKAELQKKKRCRSR